MSVVVESYQKSNFNEDKSALGVNTWITKEQFPFRLFFGTLIPMGTKVPLPTAGQQQEGNALPHADLPAAPDLQFQIPEIFVIFLHGGREENKFEAQSFQQAVNHWPLAFFVLPLLAVLQDLSKFVDDPKERHPKWIDCEEPKCPREEHYSNSAEGNSAHLLLKTELPCNK
ncbi:uncharacterized protein LJ206_014168 [Theristicus caerulescens]